MFHSGTIFEKKKIPYDFLKAAQFIKCLRYFVKCSVASKFCEENNTEAVVISKNLKFSKDDGTDTNFIAPLRIHFQRCLKVL